MYVVGQLTWLVYIIGAAIGGRVSFNTNEEHDSMDGELVCRVLQLMQLTDSRLTQEGCERLELAFLSFFEQFRKIYVGDQVGFIFFLYSFSFILLCANFPSLRKKKSLLFIVY